MKHISLIALLLLVLSASAFAQKVSENEAATVATNFFQHKSGRTSLGMESLQTTSLRSSSPNYYIFEPADGQGYVLVAANKAAYPILGYSLDHSFPTDNMPDGMQYLLQCFDEQLDYVKTNRISATPELLSLWKQSGIEQTESILSVAPLLQSNWNQGFPYNNETPTNASGTHALTGCVATAMAQLMNYWNFPSQPTATSFICNTDLNPFDPDSDVDGTWCRWVGGGYNWGLITDNYNNTSTADQRAEVAKLMYDCGIGAQMDFGTNVSNATADHAAYAMDVWFGYSDCPVYVRSDYSTYDWVSIMKSNLNSGRPMYYGGDNRTMPGGPGTGHAWVVDGYDSSNKFNMNWGWGGTGNGYFSLTAITPTVFGTTFVLTNNQHMFLPLPQGICQLNATLTDNQSNAHVDVAKWIHSNASIYSGGVASFNAGEEIILTDGFVANNGSDFHAFILGCIGDLAAAPAEDRNQPETITANAGDVVVAPNPTSANTTIRYTIGADQSVEMLLYSVTGQLLSTPVALQQQSAGAHDQELDLSAYPEGIYLLVLKMGDQVNTKRIVRIR